MSWKILSYYFYKEIKTHNRNMRILLLLCSFILVGHAQASPALLDECEILENNSNDKKNNSLNTLQKGKNDWIFLPENDFSDNFTISPQLEKNFKRLNEAFKRKNIQLVVALLPTRGMADNRFVMKESAYDVGQATESYQKLANRIRKLGVAVATINDFSSYSNFYYKHDYHWRGEGAELMAQKVSEIIQALPVYTSLQKETYKTEIKEEEHKGSFNKLIQKKCGIEIKPEIIKTYKTYKTKTKDDKQAQIALVGTSNSMNYISKANFDGFLQEKLQTNIENISFDGSDVEASILNFLHSDTYNKNKLKIVIWEIPVNRAFKKDKFYWQAIPAVYGQCTDDYILSEETIIENGMFSLFENLEIQSILAQGHYFILKFSDIDTMKLRLSIGFENGQKEFLDFDHLKTNNLIYIEPDQSNKNVLSSITGITSPGGTGKLSAQICAY